MECENKMEKEIFRAGKVSSIDYAAGTVRVVYPDKDNSVTSPLPMLCSEYNMPQVGDLVLVLHLPNGTEAGLVLGRCWTDSNRPPEGAAGLFRKDLSRTPGEAMIRYQAGVLTLQAGKVLANGSLEVTGDLTVDGRLTVAGSIAAQSVATSGDVVAGGKSLINHTHTDSLGGETAAPS